MQPNIYKLSEMTDKERDFILRRAELDITEQMKVATEVSNDISNSYEETLSTGIQAISPNNGQQATDDGALYDLGGRRISTPANGIVIQGKKKVLYP